MIQTILKKYFTKTDGKFSSFDSNKHMYSIHVTLLTCKTPWLGKNPMVFTEVQWSVPKFEVRSLKDA